MKAEGRGQKAEAIVLPIATGLILVAVWWAAVHLTKTKIFPSPLDVVKGIVTLAQRDLLWRYIGDSLMRTATGYLSAVVVGIPLGLLIGLSPTLERIMNPLIQMLRPISPLAWMPLAVIWFGISNAAPIFLIFLASLFPITVAATQGVRNVPAVFLQAGRNFGLPFRRLLTHVVLPAALPRILVGLRLAFGVAWLVLVAAEMIAVDSGLGYLIIDARNAGKRYDLVVGGMLLIGVIGLGLDILLRRTERLSIVRWGFRE
ncbi:MAG: ABC transporter permease [Thermoanaerobaculia bacterium]